METGASDAGNPFGKVKYVYLHGFASGPQSSKAQFFRARMAAEYGIDLVIPDLSEGDFERLTISRQLGVIEGVLEGQTGSVLIGSSMGGYLAALFAAEHHSLVSKLVLLAPAFWFAQRWPESLGPDAVAEWKAVGTREFFHYSLGEPRRVWWELMVDGLRHPGAPGFRQPALIFHGLADDVVPAAFSQEFASGRPNVDLRLLPSDHQLTDQVDVMWRETTQFLFG